MDFKIFLSTFMAVFIAELADKTQIVGLGMSAKSGKPLLVWLGSVGAYMIVTAVTVLIGAVAGHLIKPELVRYIGAFIFICIGFLILSGKI